jgi:hypothetical protein
LQRGEPGKGVRKISLIEALRQGEVREALRTARALARRR